MKLKRLIGILLDTIYRDHIYLISPIINWTLIDGVNRHFRDNYNKVLPTLLKWQEKGYISLVNDGDTIFIFHPEKLPLKEDLRSESILVKKEEIIDDFIHKIEVYYRNFGSEWSICDFSQNEVRKEVMKKFLPTLEQKGIIKMITDERFEIIDLPSNQLK